MPLSNSQTTTASVDAGDPAQPLTQSAPGPIVVMSFDGTSLADPAGIANVARCLVTAEEHGARVVCVVSAMGETTEDLLTLAGTVTEQPPLRELDMLLSVAEQAAAALVAMAVCDLGHDGISLTGAQAGVVANAIYGDAEIVDVQTLRILSELRLGRIVVVAGDQGLSVDDDIITLRGDGPEATAAALAAALGATANEPATEADAILSSARPAVSRSRRPSPVE